MTARRAVLALALVVGLAHLPFLPSSLEDIDSVNFALGVRDFDVALHRPHPPGYPVYIAAGKAMVAASALIPGSTRSQPSAVEARSLALLSLISIGGAALLLYRGFAALTGPRDVTTRPWRTLDVVPFAATAVTLCCPLVWSLAVRPMSDAPGLLAIAAAQACLLAAWWWQTPGPDGDRRLDARAVASSGRLIVLGALLAGFAVGVRVQTLWLTAPLLALVLLDRVGRGAAGALLGSGLTFATGALLWAVPLVVASGGLSAYLAALGTQAGEDIEGGEMLYVNPAPRLVAAALRHSFVDPWDSTWLAAAVLLLAGAGIVRLLRGARRTALALAVMGGPYLGFHLLFQDTSYTRYALPLVPVMAYLAVRGLEALHPRAVLAGAAAVSTLSVVVAAPAVAAYSAVPAPAVRALAALEAEAGSQPPAALGMHQTFVRPLEAETVTIGPRLDAPPRREWLELVRFWKANPTGVIWFLADPRRTDLAVVDPEQRRDLTPIRWSPVAHPVFGGLRPAAVDWLRMSPPRWIAEEGWSLTPEMAGMARLMGKGPHLEPIGALVRRESGEARVMIGGRNLAAPTDPAAHVVVAVDGRPVGEWDVPAGFFLHTLDLAAGTLAGEGPWARLTVRATPASGDAPIPTAIEQFNLQPPGALIWAFDTGWHEAEYSPALGVWHWSGERSALRIIGAATDVRVTMRVESPLRYFGGPSEVRALAGDIELARATIRDSQEWSFDVPLAALTASNGSVVLETSQTFVPADRSGTADQRQLGLRVFDLRVDRAGLR